MRQMTKFLIIVLFGFVFTHAINSKDYSSLDLEKITSDNVSQLTPLATFVSDNSSILDLKFTNDGNSLLIAQQSGGIFIWNINEHHTTKILEIDHPTQAAFSPTLADVVCACGNQSPVVDVERYSLNGGFRQDLISQFGPVFALSWSTDEKKVAVSGGWSRDESRFEVWDVVKDQKLITLSDGHWVSHMAFEPAHSSLIAVGLSNSIELWDYEAHSKLFSFEQEYRISQFGTLPLFIGDLSFNSDGSILASMSPEGFIWLWDTKSGEMKGAFRDASIKLDMYDTYSPSTCELIFSPNNRLLISSNGETIRIWDASTGVLLRTINEKASHLTFNAEGTLLAISDVSGDVNVWAVS